MIRLISSIILMFSLHSCANYIAKIHKQFDRHEYGSRRKRSQNTFDIYRNKSSRPYGMATTTGGNKFVSPQVRRYYRPKEVVKKRYRAGDLEDNKTVGSLWVDPGKGSRLSVHQEGRQGEAEI